MSQFKFSIDNLAHLFKLLPLETGEWQIFLFVQN